jgi:hypothetical protein
MQGTLTQNFLTLLHVHATYPTECSTNVSGKERTDAIQLSVGKRGLIAVKMSVGKRGLNAINTIVNGIERTECNKYSCQRGRED